MIIWFTGLSGSGKTILSDSLRKRLEKSGYLIYQIDGDAFRKQEKRRNTFSRKEILENNYQIISHCRKAQKDYDFIIVSAISPYKETRKRARATFGKEYLEIFLNCPLTVLIKRDCKKLYTRALAGEIKNLIGFSSLSPYEPPENPEIELQTDKETVEESANKVINYLEKKYDF